jgi:hypothetical protein
MPAEPLFLLYGDGRWRLSRVPTQQEPIAVIVRGIPVQEVYQVLAAASGWLVDKPSIEGDPQGFVTHPRPSL